MNNEKIQSETVALIKSRRTVRSFLDKPLSQAQISVLLESAMWAPSARNMQPCCVRALTDKAALDAINTDFKNLVGWNTPAYTRWDINPVYQGAPALFFIFAEHDASLDAGIMVQNIVLAAESLGLSSCIIGSIGALMNAKEGEKWKTALDIPENRRFLIAVAVGTGNETPPVKERKPENFKEISKVEI